jgi:hypothetical protein
MLTRPIFAEMPFHFAIEDFGELDNADLAGGAWTI